MWEGYKNNIKYFHPWMQSPREHQHTSYSEELYDYIYYIPLLQNLDEWQDLKIGISLDIYCPLCLSPTYIYWRNYSLQIITCKKCKRVFHHDCFQNWKKKQNLEKFFYCPFCKFSLSNDLLKLFDLKKGDFEITSKNGAKFIVFFELLKTRLSTKENSDQISKEFLQQIFSQSNSFIVERILKWVYSGFDYIMMNEYTEDDEKDINLVQQNSDFLQIDYETYEQEFNDTIQKIFKCENFKDQFNKKSKYHGIVADMKKLYQTESTKDFKIIVEEKEIKIHKFILQARSQLFYSMFENVDDPSNSVHDYSAKSLEAIEVLFEYFYTNEIPDNLPEKIKNELEDAFEFYQISEDPLQINSSLFASFITNLTYK
ncbi:speckle-type poz protein [Anaeramoeba ignava]|uniref:Speckle-type poz protein n=1 Tax=Anaeramoeba ignava TaxID=1746090 RepID=A0A9Q0LIR0_ANAIG|nr:speckle-type poz protein [Anaeramoeba ignava]